MFEETNGFEKRDYHITRANNLTLFTFSNKYIYFCYIVCRFHIGSKII